MTLTELLIAMVLMGIVMLGIVSVDFAVRGMQKNISRDTVVTMRTSATMLDMAKNAAAMTGDQNNLGWNDSVADRYCFREDINSSSVPNNTPHDYSDDRWICYQQSGTNILKCSGATGAPPSNCGIGSFILGTAIAAGLNIQFIRDNNETVQNSFVAISITNRFNPAQPASSPDNPEVTMTTKVSPAIQSF